jgi:hypothetical protein
MTSTERPERPHEHDPPPRTPFLWPTAGMGILFSTLPTIISVAIRYRIESTGGRKVEM